MDRVKVDLQHCYGIKALKYEFDFTGAKKAYAIYAPNGAMKSSLALTFKDLSNASSGAVPKDRIFPTRVTVANVTDENDALIANDRVLVIESYDDKVAPSEKTCALLVDEKLRARYEQLQAKVDDAKLALLTQIKITSKSKSDLEREISLVLARVPNDLRRALNRVKVEVEEQAEAPFAKVEWDKVFAGNIVTALGTKDLNKKIAEYILRYDELLEKSAFFRKGIFDHYNANEIATNLAKNGFFKANHTVNLKSIGKIVEVNTEVELKDVIEEERKAILEDEKLVERLGAVQAQLDKNAELRGFRSYLMENMYILPHLDNVDKFKEDVIKSYLKTNSEYYFDLLKQYDEVREQELSIFEEAAQQTTQWEEVIRTFNDRFIVPFTLHVDNRADVVAGKDKLMKLGFTYDDGDEHAAIERDELLKYLSNGEKKAFYILNVIFEIERRTKDQQETLIIVDDLADSFDYQNKYAIIDYLRDISGSGFFKQIILTHNFDFLRTVQGRLVGYAQCLIGIKSNAGIALEKLDGIKNIFNNKWKPAFFENDAIKIASIAFLRNLVENGRGESDPAYKILTKMLHWRPETAALTIGDLDNLFRGETHLIGNSDLPDQPIIDLIDATADACLTAGPGFNLENKVVLAIATRLRAERFMVDKLNDAATWQAITVNQAWKLVSAFKKSPHCTAAAASTLDKVLLMTPENIHLNSFMYEPLIDMNEDRLKELYLAVKALA